MNNEITILFESSADASTVMERDKMFLERYCAEDSLFLRLYQWSRPTVSLGRLQNCDELLDMARIEKLGIGVVVRPTGGRQIFHKGDISFSLVIPKSHLEAIGITIEQRQQWLGSLLGEALQLQGISVEHSAETASRRSMVQTRMLPCFLTSVKNELAVNGKKLLGMAQLVEHRGVLIQGSMPLTTDYLFLPELERLSCEERKRQRLLLEKKSSALSEILPESAASFNEIVHAVHSVLGRRFQTVNVSSSL